MRDHPPLTATMELAPIMMPLSLNPYEFPALPKEAFKGLPGTLADSLPDKFGNALIHRHGGIHGDTQGHLP